MVIYFIRHGHPDYKNDCLTELGKLQAEKAAQALYDLGIEKIFSSTNGRALETAGYTAQLLNLPINRCDFMREISWESITGDELLLGGHPWNVANHFASLGISLKDHDWRNKEPYCKSAVVKKVDKVIEGFDNLLLELGYERDGDFYNVVGDDTDKSIAIFSHGGSSTAVLSHLLNVPFAEACGIFWIDLASISVIHLSDEKGARVMAKLKGLNDTKHTRGLTVENFYGN